MYCFTHARAVLWILSYYQLAYLQVIDLTAADQALVILGSKVTETFKTNS